MPPYSNVFGFDQQQNPQPPPKKALGQQHDILVKEAKQRLSASMDVIFHVLQCSGVSKSTITEWRQDITKKEKHQQVLQLAQQYLLCFATEQGACFLLMNGWEALSRLNHIRYRRALRVIRHIKLSGGGNIRKANYNLQQLAEASSASQLGLYKANTWKNRMERQAADGASRSLSM